MLKLDSTLLKFNLPEVISGREGQLKGVLQDLEKRASDPNDWLGWLTLHNDQKTFSEIQNYADSVIESKKFENLIVLGIGGSALGPQALLQALHSPLWNELSSEKRNNALKVYFVDNVDPDWTHNLLTELNLEKSLFCVITKSGGTAETISAFLWALDNLKKKLGDNWKDNLVLITDPEKGTLRAFANKENIKSFSVPANVGGRFSVFSAVGLLPLALTGIKIEKFRLGLVKAYKDMLESKNNLNSNIAINLACALIYADQKLGKKINPLMPYSSHLGRISDWYVQLVAESLGKTPQIGITPIKAVGATDQHSQLQLFAEGPLDKIIFFLKVAEFKHEFKIPETIIEGFSDLAGETLNRLIEAQQKGTAQALAQKNVPSLTLELERINEENLAYLLFTFQLMTAIAGSLYGIDAFNQPGVELSKKYTYAFLGKKGYEEYLKDLK